MFRVLLRQTGFVCLQTSRCVWIWALLTGNEGFDGCHCKDHGCWIDHDHWYAWSTINIIIIIHTGRVSLVRGSFNTLRRVWI